MSIATIQKVITRCLPFRGSAGVEAYESNVLLIDCASTHLAIRPKKWTQQELMNWFTDHFFPTVCVCCALLCCISESVGSDLYKRWHKNAYFPFCFLWWWFSFAPWLRWPKISVILYTLSDWHKADFPQLLVVTQSFRCLFVLVLKSGGLSVSLHMTLGFCFLLDLCQLAIS